jgi:hypothetical protein
MKYRPTKSKKWADQRRNRRIIQEYGFQEAKRVGALDSAKEQKKKDKEVKKQIKAQKKIEEKKTSTKTGLHIGQEYQEKLDNFIAKNGDISSCPFD